MGANGKMALMLAAAALAALSACASHERINAGRDFVVRVADDGAGVKILEYRGGATRVRIPARLQGLPVTAIGSSAFARSKLTSVSIPSTVTYIGSAAFWHNRLSSVSIPEGVAYIGSAAFGRNNFSVAEMPDSTLRIGEDDADFAVEVIGGGAGVKITEYRGGRSSVRIPSRIQGLPVTAIGSSAFARGQISSVSIPSTVTYIGSAAFWLNQISSVSIPAGVTHIGPSAFGRNWISDVTLPGSVSYLGARAFDPGVRITSRAN